MPDISDADVDRIAVAFVKHLQPVDKLVVQPDASALIRATAHTVVQEYDAKFWARLGYNVADVKDVERLHKNLGFLDSLRQGSSNVGAALTKTIAIAIVLGILAWIAIGAKFSLTGVPAPGQIGKP